MARPRRRLLYLLTALAVLASACGNSDDDDATADATATSAPAEEPAAETTDDADPTDGEATDGEATDGEATDGEATDGSAEATSARDTFVPITDVPGVTDDEIAYASLATKANNPLGTDIKDAYNEGIRAYFAWRNSQGGIYGRELALTDEIDDEFALNQVKALEIIGADNHFGVFTANLIFSGAADLNEAGIPTYAWGISATELNGREALFGHVGVGCTTGCTGRAVPYVASLVGAETVAAIGYGASENSKVCTQAQRDSYELYADDIGVTVGYFNDDLAFGLPSGIGPEVTAMKDAGVEFISTCMDLNGMKTLAQELDRQGMSDVVLYHPNTYNQSFVAEAGDLFEGDYVVPAFVPFEYDTQLETQLAFFEFMDAQGSDLSELAMTGWINADLAFTGLLEAGPEFDRQSVIDATNQLTAYDAGGLINPIDWTRQHNAPTVDDPTTNGYAQECFAVVQVQGGGFVPVSEPDTPFLCWSNQSLDWGEPVATSFGE